MAESLVTVDNNYNTIPLMKEKLPIPVRLVGTWNFVNSSSIGNIYHMKDNISILNSIQ
jgi:hypothetical protein